MAMPIKLAVQDESGKHLFWADETTARGLIRDRKVEMLRTKKRVRALRAVVPLRVLNGERGTLRTRKYSHNRETEKNVHGVWTLVHIPDDVANLFTRRWEDDNAPSSPKRKCTSSMNLAPKIAA